MEVHKKVLLTEVDPEPDADSERGTVATQDHVISEAESVAASSRVGSGTFQSQFSHESVYSEGHFLPTSDRGEDLDDLITSGSSRRHYESTCEDILEEDEEEEDDEEEDGGHDSVEGWGGSENESEEEDEPARELRDSDYDTDLEMNDDKWLHPEKYDHDTSGLSKYLKACSDLGVQPIKYFIKHMQDEHLKFRYHGLGPEAMEALAVPLETNTTIEHLDLEGNWIMAEGTLHLCNVLKENVFLTELNLSENKIENEGAIAVCNLLIENRTIERLDLAGNSISDTSGEVLHDLLTQHNSVLKHLNLRHNKLEDSAALWLKEAIVENETLEHLDVAWNHFQSKGCVLLAEALKENVGLRELSVAMNGFGRDGGLELGEAIYANRTLLRLDASYCRLPEDCVNYLTHGLEHNDNLHFLDLSYNALVAESCQTIVEGVKNNDCSSLTLLNFGNTRVHDKTDDLCKTLKEERGLEVLHGGVLEEYRKDNSEADPMAAFKKDPFSKLKQWLATAGYRLIDLLRHFDKDQSLTISIDEFRSGVLSTGIDITDEQLEILVSRLDNDGNGEIDFSELVEGDKEHRKTKRDLDRIIQAREQKEKEKLAEEEREKNRIKESMMAAKKAVEERRASRAIVPPPDFLLGRGLGEGVDEEEERIIFPDSDDDDDTD